MARFFSILFPLVLLCTVSLAQAPDRLVVSYEHGGGMDGSSTKIYISGDSIAVIYSRFDIRNEYRDKLSQEERDDLWKCITDNNFFSIESKEHDGIIHDKPSTELTISNNKRWNKVESGATRSVNKGQSDRWRAVVSKVREVANKAVDRQKVEVEFVFDESLFPDGQRYYMSVENEACTFKSNENPGVRSFKCRLAPGNYNIQSHLIEYKEGDATWKTPKYTVSGHLKLEVTNSTKKVNILLEDKTMKLGE